jgi:hypothetical protein
MAYELSQLCNMVSHVGPQEQADFDTGAGSRLLSRCV